ncbi:hypothetical protein NDU88_000073, partial [Pleurodeles waltl]
VVCTPQCAHSMHHVCPSMSSVPPPAVVCTPYCAPSRRDVHTPGVVSTPQCSVCPHQAWGAHSMRDVHPSVYSVPPPDVV